MSAESKTGLDHTISAKPPQTSVQPPSLARARHDAEPAQKATVDPSSTPRRSSAPFCQDSLTDPHFSQFYPPLGGDPLDLVGTAQLAGSPGKLWDSRRELPHPAPARTGLAPRAGTQTCGIATSQKPSSNRKTLIRFLRFHPFLLRARAHRSESRCIDLRGKHLSHPRSPSRTLPKRCQEVNALTLTTFAQSHDFCAPQTSLPIYPPRSGPIVKSQAAHQRSKDSRMQVRLASNTSISLLARGRKRS